MIIHIVNRQKIRKPNAEKLKAALTFFLDKAAPGSRWQELSLVLTDDDGIRKIKRQFFGIDCVTDVISFSSRSRPADGNRRMAEIVVNVERACLEGKIRHGLEREFALYLAHGCDHLAGHDDRAIKERKNMRRRELLWLSEAAKLNLLSGLFQVMSLSQIKTGTSLRRPSSRRDPGSAGGGFAEARGGSATPRQARNPRLRRGERGPYKRRYCRFSHLHV